MQRILPHALAEIAAGRDTSRRLNSQRRLTSNQGPSARSYVSKATPLGFAQRRLDATGSGPLLIQRHAERRHEMKAAAWNLGEGSGRNETNTDDTTGDFVGTANPRHLRVIAGLLRRPMTREQIDREAGASNGPDVIAELRRRRLEIPCDRAPVIDRDGRDVMRGVYHCTATDRRRIHRWLRERESIEVIR